MDGNINKGTVVWFSPKKGYGFIKCEDGKEYFAHFSGISMEGYKTLKPNQGVEFEIKDSDKGPIATNIMVVEEAPEED